MASVSREKTTQAAFEAFVQRPENAEKRFELINGEIFEVPSNPFVSEIAGLIVFFIRLFLRENKLEGHVTTEGGGYIVDGQITAPDVAYISKDRQESLAQKGFNPLPPELAVEVISDPGNNAEQTDLRRKLAHYRRAGVVVWVVDYVARQVEVHLPDNTVTLYDEESTLTGGDVLPGFELAVKDIFPSQGQTA
jgi:Uma2 family endonuclease